MTNPVQTQEQKRAAYALKHIKRLLDDQYKGRKSDQAQELKAHASSLPAMIQMNGLGPASAFYLSKKKRHADLYHLLSGWLTGSDQPYKGASDLLEGITQGDMHQYLLAQAEAQALLEWVKKFATALVEPSEQEAKP